MNKTLITALVLALLAALGAFWLLRSDGRTGGAEAARPAGAVAPPDSRTSAEIEDVAAPPDPVASGSAPSVESRTAAASSAPPSAVIADGFEIAVVRADDETPVAGAEVFAFAGEPADLDADEARDLARLDAWIAANGIALRSDALGSVRIPKDDDGTLVVASSGELWGRAWFSAPGEGEAPPTLELERDRTIRVLVVDGAPGVGAPVEGVTVELRRRSDSGWENQITTARTGADGLARFAHVQTHRASRREDATWTVRLAVVANEAIGADLDRDALPTEPIRLVLPSSGSVAVRVLDERGEPWLADANVRMSAIPPGESREVSPFAGGNRPTFRQAVEDGVAVFPWVAVGSELAIGASRQRGDVEASAYAPGPVAAGERVEVPVAFGAQHPVLIARVLGLRGAPLIDTELTVEIERDSMLMRTTSRQFPRSDVDGRIRIDLHPGFSEDSERTARVLRGGREHPDAVASVDLARDFPNGVTDIGDVALAAPSAFVRGRVVDETGAGIAEARVELARRSDGGWWEELYDVSTTSGSDGAFQVLTAPAGERFRATAERSSFASLPVDFEPGADLLLRMALEGTISGSVLLDDGIPTDQLTVETRRSDDTVEGLRSTSVPLDASGAFVAPQLAAGTYGVAVNTKNGRIELFSVPDVLVVSGRDTADPRLQEIDLRGELHAYTLTLVRPDGKTELQGDFKHGPAGAKNLDRWGFFSGTEVVILSTDGAIDVDLMPRGFAPVQLRDLRGDETVELSEGLSIIVRLTPGSALPEPPVYLHPALAPTDTESFSVDWSTPAFDELREVRVKGVRPGRLQLHWIVERRDGSSAMATQMPVEPPQFFEALPGVEDQVFEVVLSAEKLAEAVASMGW